MPSPEFQGRNCHTPWKELNILWPHGYSFSS